MNGWRRFVLASFAVIRCDGYRAYAGIAIHDYEWFRRIAAAPKQPRNPAG
jgi:hypothetical protein